jgi:hypothetical protein
MDLTLICENFQASKVYDGLEVELCGVQDLSSKEIIENITPDEYLKYHKLKEILDYFDISEVNNEFKSKDIIEYVLEYYESDVIHELRKRNLTELLED